MQQVHVTFMLFSKPRPQLLLFCKISFDQKNIINKTDIMTSNRGARDGAVVRALASHQCGLGSNPGVDAICGLSFVVGFLPCSERFFSGYSGFPVSSKPNSSKFQFDQESGRDEEPLGGCATSKSLFIIYARAKLLFY